MLAYLKPNTHRRRRQDETVESRRVGGVNTNSQLVGDSFVLSSVWTRPSAVANWVTAYSCVVRSHRRIRREFMYTPPTRQNSLVSSAVCIRLKKDTFTVLWRLKHNCHILQFVCKCNYFRSKRTICLMKLMASAMLSVATKRQYCSVLPLLRHSSPVFDEICGTTTNLVFSRPGNTNQNCEYTTWQVSCISFIHN